MSRPPARPGERRAQGDRAEDRAAAYLEARGFTILDRNHQSRRGEVDLVAERGELLVFVEVRSRADDVFGGPAATVGMRKRRRVIAAATDWAARAGLLDRRAIRFDVIAILDREAEGESVEWIENAFDASGAVI